MSATDRPTLLSTIRRPSSGHAPDSPVRLPRVCIATLEINGPSRNGGIGTGYTALAETLAAAGHDVTVLCLRGSHVDSQSFPHWVRHYQDRPIRLVPLEDGPLRFGGSSSLVTSYRAFEWLRRQDFDIVHFHEWLGFGYYSLLARHQGLAFASTTFCVGVHSPTIWVQEANQEFLDDIDLLECDSLERRCVELADELWSPSRYLLDWMRERGWPLPDHAFVRPYLVPSGCQLAALPRDEAPVRELVFFGRLEVRKGLMLFCDALDRLAQATVYKGFRVTFLGKPRLIQGIDARDYLRLRSKRWPFSVRVLSDRDHSSALEYLRGPGRLAIMPSLIDNAPLTVTECLAAGIPFLASHTGGIPEVVARDDHQRVLFAPNPAGLAARLGEALRCGVSPARPAHDAEDNRRFWTKWHAGGRQTADRLSADRRPPTADSRSPLVSLCLVHFNRPALLRQALQSIEEQDYPSFEVVLVDDGSTAPEALAALEELGPDFERHGWQLVKQENCYLGAARNTAARHARGEYLLFMDDDNVARPHEISTLVRVAERTGAEIVTTLMDFFEGDEAPQAGQQPTCRWLMAGTESLAGIARNCFGDANALVRRTTFERVGGFTEDRGITHEDWEFFARAVLAGCRLEIVPEALFWYRVGPESMIRSTPVRLNHERCLRPYLEDLPAVYHDLVRLAQGQALRIKRLTQEIEHLGAGKPLRYHLADRLHAWLGRLPLVRRLLKRALSL